MPFLRCCLVVGVLLLVAGCDTQGQQDDFVDAAFGPVAGFTRTDDRGRVVEADADDWRTAPLYVTRIFVEPAYPNPTGGQFVSIQVSVREFNAVPGGLELAALDANGRFARLDRIDDASSPGAYVLTFNPTFLGRRGLVRVFILDGIGEVVSYGDLLVE